MVIINEDFNTKRFDFSKCPDLVLVDLPMETEIDRFARIVMEEIERNDAVIGIKYLSVEKDYLRGLERRAAIADKTKLIGTLKVVTTC